MSNFRQDFLEAKEVLDNFIRNDKIFSAMEFAGILMVSALKEGKKIISCGNGGSMSDAMHFAEELTGKFKDHRQAIAALSISDPAHITCTANDYGFDYIFSRYIEALGIPGDVLLAISTSGNSSNIIQATQAAQNKGMKVVALTGKDGGKLAQLADIELRVTHNGYSDRIQEIHIKIIHALIQYIEQNM